MARACDRCSRLKTQCNGDLPCNRCQRLELECTQTRPVLAKGRPKRDASHARARRPPNTSHHVTSQRSTSPQRTITDVLSYPPPSEASLDLVRYLPELPLPEPIAAYLLDLVFSPMPNVGLLEVFCPSRPQAPYHVGTSPAPLKRARSSPSPPIDSKALLYTLMVVSATLCSPPDSSINITSLQQYALNSVPALYGNSRDLRMEDALSLCYLSYMGCLSPVTIKVAERWAVLAVIISRQAQEDEDEQDSEPESFHERVSWLISINDRIFSLLHYRQPFGKQLSFTLSASSTNTQSKLPTSIVDKMSIGGVLEQPSDLPRVYMNPDYFSLFLPLLQPLDLVLEEPSTKTSSWATALSELEKYFLGFPPSLLAYNDVKHLYQVEAMLWFHGMHLLLYGKRDFYSCFDDKSWTSSPAFLKSAEHAVLLGETIPAIARLMKSSSQLSPATVYFLLLSSVIHALLLRHCLGNPELSPRLTLQTDCDKAGWSKIIESTHLHLFILRRVREESVTCAIDLVPAIEAILHPIYAAATTGRTEWDTDFSVLKLYRWTKRGRGIVKISPKIAEEISKLTVGGVNEHRCSNGAENEKIRRDVLALCDPRARRSMPGRFSLTLRDV